MNASPLTGHAATSIEVCRTTPTTASRTTNGGRSTSAAAGATPSDPSPTLRFYPAYCFTLSPTYNIWVKLTVADVLFSLTQRNGYPGSLTSPSSRHTQSGLQCRQSAKLSESLGQALYFYLNHPVRFVRLTGVLVSCEQRERFWMMELDDGSGAVIDVIYRKEQPIPAVFSVTPGDVDRAAGKNISARNAATPAGTVGTSLVEHDTRSWSPEQEAQVTTPGPQGLDMTGFKVGKVVKVKGTVSVFRGSRQIDLKRLSVLHETNEEVRSWSELVTFQAEVLSIPWTLSEDSERALLRTTRGERIYGDRELRTKRIRRSTSEDTKKSIDRLEVTPEVNAEKKPAHASLRRVKRSSRAKQDSCHARHHPPQSRSLASADPADRIPSALASF